MNYIIYIYIYIEGQQSNNECVDTLEKMLKSTNSITHFQFSNLYYIYN